ncbi:hypothetical protein [Nitrincola alkalilacustris]|uniref:hypothetical protein n=1 Tax=Nitrincola alkalilacustris TaxID=1571224 RepID=UPI00124CE799|nr:hypothetical protein [Nitrincola alkalilacustris]
MLLGDLTYASLSDSENLSGIPVKGSVRQSSFTAAAGYQVVNEPDLSIDALFGARFWQVRASVNTPAPLPIQSASKTESWTDPILAARMNARISPEWSFILYGDIGGFGVGSEKTWQWVGTMNYQLRDDLYLSGGYRQMKVDFDDGRTRVDVEMSGPIIGMTLRF